MNDAAPDGLSTARGPGKPLLERLLDEQSQCWQRGERPLVETLLEQHPGLAANPDAVLDLIYHEVVQRDRRGEKPRLEEYLHRFPQFEAELRQQFELHHHLEEGLLPDAGSTACGPGTRVPRAGASGPAAWPDVADYQILADLGRGGMGVVYQAWHVRLQRQVALKMLKAGAHAGPQERARFRTEAEAVARLQHPNIVQIYEVGEAGGQPYVALEYVDGGSLIRKLAATPLPARPAAELVEVLARAVQYAHRQGVVHRDLTPGNVLLTADGTPKISDFSLAKILVGGGEAHTQSGAILGTPSYMAPEQAGGKSKQVGPAADIYALGAILYECLTGRAPFRAETPMETLLQVLSGEAVPPRRLQPKAPRDLETICLKCLHKEPQKRYPTALALAEDLRRFLEDKPIQARRASATEQAWRWCRRNPALAVAAGLAAGALLSVAVVSILFALHQSRATRHLREEEKRTREEQERTQAALQKAETLSAGLTRQQGLTLYEQGGVGHGMLLLARSLELAPAEEAGFSQSIRSDLARWHQQLRPLRGMVEHPGQTLVMALSPDGRALVTGGSDHTARLWSVATGQPVGEPLRHPGEVRAVALSPDDTRVLTGTGDSQAFRGAAQVWDVATGRPIGPPLRHQHWVRAVAFSPDGKTVLTGSFDTMAGLWEAATGRPIGPPLGHQGAVNAVTFNPDGRKVLTASEDGTARLWDAGTGQPLGEPFEHPSAVQAAAFSPDGHTVLTGSSDRTARLWKVATGKPIGSPLHNRGAVLGVAYSPDGRSLLTASREGVRVWASFSKPTSAVLRHRNWVGAVAFSPDGTKILTGTGNPLWMFGGTAQLWDAATRKPLGQGIRHDLWVPAVAFSPDGKTILTGSGHPLHGPGEARLWETETSRPLTPPLKHGAVVLGVAFSPDGRHFLTASRDGLARLWESATGRLLRAVPPGREALPRPTGQGFCAVAFSPDGETFLTGSEDRTAQLWETATGQPIGKPLPHPDWVMAVAFSPDGRTILTGCYDSNARLWETATGRPTGVLFPHHGWVRAVAFSPDGKTILTGSGDKTARLWDAATGRPMGAPFRHENWIFAAAFSPDGRNILTGGLDFTVRLWEVVPAPVEGAAERINLWAQVLTGMEVDAGGSLHVLDALTWHQRRQRLREWGGPPVPAESVDAPAAAEESDGPPLPAPGVLHTRRARAYAMERRWEFAAADYAQAVAAQPGDVELGYEQAAALLLAGNTDEYRRVCGSMLERFGRTTNPQIAYHLARSCVLTPNPVVAPDQVVQLASQSVVVGKAEVTWYLHALGLAHYRAGQYDQALQRLQQAAKANPEWPAQVLNWQALALAHHRLGQADEARQWLDRAVAWGHKVTQEMSKSPGANPPVQLHDWLEYHLLQREAEALFRVQP